MILGRRIFRWTMQLSNLLGQIVDTPEPTGLPTLYTTDPLIHFQTNAEPHSPVAVRQDSSCLVVPLLQGSISLEVVPTHPGDQKG